MNKIINVVHICDTFYPYRGGSTIRLLNLLNGICEKSSNFNFKILTRNYTKQLKRREKLRDNIEIIRFVKYAEVPLLLVKLSCEMKIDIMHAHNYRPGLFAYITNIFLNKPFIIEMHAIYETSLLKQMIGKNLLKKAERIITLSERAKNYLNNVYKIDKNKINVICNGINIDYFDKHKATPKVLMDYKQIFEFLSGFQLKIGYVGSINEWQGIYNFIKIAKDIISKNKNIGFLIVGDGPEYIKVEKIIQEHSLQKRILIHHAIHYDDVPSIYKNIDALLMPRTSTLATETTIPLKPLDAIACGRMVIGTNVGGLIDLQKSFPENIFLFNSCQKISSFIENIKKEDTIKKIPKNLFFFSISYQATKLIKTYHQLTNN